MSISELFKPLAGAVAGLLLLSMFFLVPLAPPARSPVAHAQFSTETPFGGLNAFQFSCTCSSNVLLFISDYATNKTLRLVYQPGLSKLYLNFNIFGQYLLGSYTPRAGQCTFYVGTKCVNISADGMHGFLPGTGTSN